MQQLCLLLEQVKFGRKPVHDANIVATRLAYGIPRLITYNVEDFRRLDGLIRSDDGSEDRPLPRRPAGPDKPFPRGR